MFILVVILFSLSGSTFEQIYQNSSMIKDNLSMPLLSTNQFSSNSVSNNIYPEQKHISKQQNQQGNMKDNDQLLSIIRPNKNNMNIKSDSIVLSQSSNLSGEKDSIEIFEQNPISSIINLVSNFFGQKIKEQKIQNEQYIQIYNYNIVLPNIAQYSVTKSSYDLFPQQINQITDSEQHKHFIDKSYSKLNQQKTITINLQNGQTFEQIFMQGQNYQKHTSKKTHSQEGYIKNQQKISNIKQKQQFNSQTNSKNQNKKLQDKNISLEEYYSKDRKQKYIQESTKPQYTLGIINQRSYFSRLWDFITTGTLRKGDFETSQKQQLQADQLENIEGDHLIEAHDFIQQNNRRQFEKYRIYSKNQLIEKRRKKIWFISINFGVGIISMILIKLSKIKKKQLTEQSKVQFKGIRIPAEQTD